MDNNHYLMVGNYTFDDMQALGVEQYCDDGASTNSTGSSPIMYMSTIEQASFDAYSEPQMPYQYPNTSYSLPIVEFTDLTAPYEEDRRRRRSHSYDNQTTSSMHMRRRAQNRASQRAFRERKEKHAQNLQRQLDELEEKHKELQARYDDLESQNNMLQKEVRLLREETCPSPAESTAQCNDSLPTELQVSPTMGKLRAEGSRENHF